MKKRKTNKMENHNSIKTKIWRYIYIYIEMENLARRVEEELQNIMTENAK
jgi:hypothetical protein